MCFNTFITKQWVKLKTLLEGKRKDSKIVNQLDKKTKQTVVFKFKGYMS